MNHRWLINEISEHIIIHLWAHELCYRSNDLIFSLFLRRGLAHGLVSIVKLAHSISATCLIRIILMRGKFHCIYMTIHRRLFLDWYFLIWHSVLNILIVIMRSIPGWARLQIRWLIIIFSIVLLVKIILLKRETVCVAYLLIYLWISSLWSQI